MELLSYYSLCDQSLLRFDMANQMLRWSSGFPQSQLSHLNYRQLKKFLQRKGWVYERTYPYKGKLRCTESLQSIVRSTIDTSRKDK